MSNPGRRAVSISRFCSNSRVLTSRCANSAAMTLGSASRSPRQSARAARSSPASRLMLAAIASVFSRCIKPGLGLSIAPLCWQRPPIG
jgi:hypothetical protein